MPFIFDTWTHSPSQNIPSTACRCFTKQATSPISLSEGTCCPSRKVSFASSIAKCIHPERCKRVDVERYLHCYRLKATIHNLTTKLFSPSTTHTCGIRSLDSFTHRRARLAPRYRPITSRSLRRFSRVQLLLLASFDDCSTSSVQGSQPGLRKRPANIAIRSISPANQPCERLYFSSISKENIEIFISLTVKLYLVYRLTHLRNDICSLTRFQWYSSSGPPKIISSGCCLSTSA